MNTYILYHAISSDNIAMYCYAHNNYCSYWQSSTAKALTVSLVFMSNHRAVYGVEHIIYESDQPITHDSHPEFFL